MKQLFTLMVFAMIAFTINAQYVYTDFDANQNVTFSGWPNTPTLIANPDASGINTSANVGEFVRSTEQWAHCYVELDGYIDFTTGTTFQMKVHSPIACEILFKLEDKTNSNVFTEVSGNVTTTGQWEQLTYDFTGAASGTYDKIVIFFDFANGVENTFYFDDVEGPEYGGGVVLDPVELPVTFDDENVNYGLTDFGGNVSQIVEDPENSANMVAMSTKTAGSEIWAGTTVGGTTGFPDEIPFEPGQTFMSVDVWSPMANIPIRLKVEDATDPTISVETEAMTTVASGWETLVFDFDNEAAGTAEINFDNFYNKASIFFNFGTAGADEVYYWDNIMFGTVGVSDNKIEPLNFVSNPVSNELIVVSDVDVSTLTIVSIDGRQVNLGQTSSNTYDVSSLVKGVYIVLAVDINGQYFSGKIIKE